MRQMEHSARGQASSAPATIRVSSIVARRRVLLIEDEAALAPELAAEVSRAHDVDRDPEQARAFIFMSGTGFVSGPT